MSPISPRTHSPLAVANEILRPRNEVGRMRASSGPAPITSIIVQQLIDESIDAPTAPSDPRVMLPPPSMSPAEVAIKLQSSLDGSLLSSPPTTQRSSILFSSYTSHNGSNVSFSELEQPPPLRSSSDSTSAMIEVMNHKARRSVSSPLRNSSSSSFGASSRLPSMAYARESRDSKTSILESEYADDLAFEHNNTTETVIHRKESTGSRRSSEDFHIDKSPSKERSVFSSQNFQRQSISDGPLCSSLPDNTEMLQQQLSHSSLRMRSRCIDTHAADCSCSHRSMHSSSSSSVFAGKHSEPPLSPEQLQGSSVLNSPALTPKSPENSGGRERCRTLPTNVAEEDRHLLPASMRPPDIPPRPLSRAFALEDGVMYQSTEYLAGRPSTIV